METHVETLESAHFDCVVGYTVGACVVRVENGSRLWMTESCEHGARSFTFLSDCEGGTVLGFSCGRNNYVEDCTVREDGSVGHGVGAGRP